MVAVAAAGAALPRGSARPDARASRRGPEARTRASSGSRSSASSARCRAGACRERSLGSGFIFDPAGYILTNNHVVENADEIKVKLNSGDEVPREVVGRDPKTDIARAEDRRQEGPPTIAFGDSDAVEVGEWVMAIGNPFGLEFSVTAGIVSAKGRFIGQGNYDDFLQTDAPINPGNSGGPLLDLNGKVVGINTSIFSRSGGNIGIGFAIPINLAKELIPQLREKGRVTRGWIGVMIQKVTPDIADSLGLADAHGALVADVVKGGPADAAGIKVGDVIISFDGHDVKESTELPTLVAREKIGQEVPVVVSTPRPEEWFPAVQWPQGPTTSTDQILALDLARRHDPDRPCRPG